MSVQLALACLLVRFALHHIRSLTVRQSLNQSSSAKPFCCPLFRFFHFGADSASARVCSLGRHLLRHRRDGDHLTRMSDVGALAHWFRACLQTALRGLTNDSTETHSAAAGSLRYIVLNARQPSARQAPLSNFPLKPVRRYQPPANRAPEPSPASPVESPGNRLEY